MKWLFNARVCSCALAAVATAASAELPPLGAKILKTTVICEEPGRYIGWLTICRRADGGLMVVFSGDHDGQP